MVLANLCSLQTSKPANNIVRLSIKMKIIRTLLPKFLALKFWVLLSSALFATACGNKTGINPGELAPNFKLKNLSGKTIARDDLLGKATVLCFWASWCEPCIRELPSLERLNSLLSSKGGRVVGIGIDDSKANLQKVVEENGVTFLNLLDEAGLAKRRFQVKGVPETFLLSNKNKIAMLLKDNGGVEVRLTGPREWDSPESVRLIKDALGLD
jgi:peroxiredoxin